MVEIEKPRIECIEDNGDSSYGKYVVEPLEHGYDPMPGHLFELHPVNEVNTKGQ